MSKLLWRDETKHIKKESYRYRIDSQIKEDFRVDKREYQRDNDLVKHENTVIRARI